MPAIGLTDPRLGRVFAIAGSAILILLFALYGISYLTCVLFGLPFSLGLPLVVRLIGGVLVAVGLAVATSVFAYRSPSDVAVSTYLTLTKLAGRAPLAEPSGRTEPLVIDGPQKYVRNPLYSAVEVMLFGWAFVADSTSVLVFAVALLLWYALVLIPFEERELRALFGEQFERYAEEVPMLAPFTKRKKRPTQPTLE